jgi:hypothetical protein
MTLLLLRNETERAFWCDVYTLELASGDGARAASEADKAVERLRARTPSGGLVPTKPD